MPRRKVADRMSEEKFFLMAIDARDAKLVCTLLYSEGSATPYKPSPSIAKLRNLIFSTPVSRRFESKACKLRYPQSTNRFIHFKVPLRGVPMNAQENFPDLATKSRNRN